MSKKLLPLLAAATLACTAATAPAQAATPITPDSDWIADGPVRTLERVGQTLYLGGEFESLSRRTGGGLILSQAGEILPGPELDRSVLVSEPDGAGGFYAGGNFTRVDGKPRARLIHILPDGSVDQQFTSTIDGSVTSLAIGAERIFVGGFFDVLPGQDGGRNLAAVDRATGATDTSLVLGVANNAPGDIALSPDGGTLYVGGDFTCVGRLNTQATCGDAAGEVARRNAAAFDTADGSVTSWAPSPSRSVGAIEISANGATAFLGGQFMCLGSEDNDCTDPEPGQLTRRHLAGVDTQDGEPTAFIIHVGTPGDVNAGGVGDLMLRGNQLTIGGSFTCVKWNGDGDCTDSGESTRSRLARVSTGGTVAAWAPAVGDNGVTDVAAGDSGGVWVAGTFSTVEGAPRNGLAAIDAATGALLAADPKPNGRASSVAVSGDRVLAGGDISGVRPMPRGHAAAIDLQTGQPTDWDPKADGPVNDIAVDGATTYLGGDFDNVGGQARAELASVDTASAAVTPWNPDPDEDVHAVLPLGGSVYVGGAFTAIGGNDDVGYLAKLDPVTGTPDPAFPVAGDAIHALEAVGDTLYVGGEINGSDALDGKTREGAGAIDLATGEVTAWDPNFDGGKVFDLDAEGDRIYAAGDFAEVQGQTHYAVAAVDPVSGEPFAWDPHVQAGADGLSDVAADGADVAFAGAIYEVGGAQHDGAAVVDATDGSLRPWDPGINSDGRAIDIAGGAVYLGGGFGETIGLQQEGFATFTPEPASLVPPSLRGIPAPGAGLECDPGRWEGNPVLQSSWLLRGASAGGDPVFTPGDGDVGALLACRVEARNIRGAASAESQPATIARPAQPGGDTVPTGGGAGQVKVARITLSAKTGKGVRRLKGGRIAVPFRRDLPVAGTVTGTDGRPVAGAKVALTNGGRPLATATTDAAGRFTTTLRRLGRAVRLTATADGVSAELRTALAARLTSTTKKAQRARRVTIGGTIAVPAARKGVAGTLVVRRGGRKVATVSVRRSGPFAVKVAQPRGRATYRIRFVPRAKSGLVATSLALVVKRG